MRFPRLRFGLRTLLIITVLVAIPSAWLGKHWLRTRVQRPIVAKIQANGGNVWYDYQWEQSNYDSSKPPPGLAPLRAIFGDDFFATVKAVTYGYSKGGWRRGENPPVIAFEQLSDLEQLSINTESVPEGSIAKLATLQKLNSLTLTNLNIRPETLHQLAACKALTFLSFTGDQVTTEHLNELRHFPNLTMLQVINTPLTDEGLLAICEARRLKTFDLLWSNGTRSVPLTARGFQGLAQLQELEIFKLSGPANAAMAAIGKLPNVRSVQLSYDSLTDVGLLHMASLTKLVEFKSDSIQISDAGMPAFCKMLRLQWLKLEGPFITDAGLAQLSGLTNLKHLKLNSAAITDAGIPSLLPLKELEVLQLKEAKLTDQGLQQFSKLTKLKRLEITLSPNLTLQGVNQLRKQLPNCKFFDYQSSPGGGNSSEIP